MARQGDGKSSRGLGGRLTRPPLPLWLTDQQPEPRLLQLSTRHESWPQGVGAACATADGQGTQGPVYGGWQAVEASPAFLPSLGWAPLPAPDTGPVLNHFIHGGTGKSECLQ
jgi:hypothetical protein